MGTDDPALGSPIVYVYVFSCVLCAALMLLVFFMSKYT